MPFKTPGCRTLSATAFAIAFGGFAIDGHGQTDRVPHAITCPRCTVMTEKLLTLGGPGGDLLAPNSRLARDSRGRYFAEAWGGRSLLVWDSTGKSIGKLGTSGAGPGEFGGSIQSILIGPGDSVIVADHGLRVSVFSPALKFVRSFKLPGRAQSLALMPNGQFVLGAPVGGPAQVGHPYHVLDGATGAIVRSFGASGAAIRPGQPPDSYRSLFVPSWDARYLWHPLRSEYAVEGWNVETGAREAFDLSSSPWYVPPAAPPRMTAADEAAFREALQRGNMALADSLDAVYQARRSPYSSVTLVGADRDGLLWFVGHEPAPWVNPATAATSPTRKYIVEVVDPATRTKLLSTPFSPGFVSGIRGTDLVQVRQSNGDGVTTLTVWRVRVQRR
jgi:hypothetical protein